MTGPRYARLVPATLLLACLAISGAWADDGASDGVLLLGPDGRALHAVRLGRTAETFEGAPVFDPKGLEYRSVGLERGRMVPAPRADDSGVPVVWGEGLAATQLGLADGKIVGRRLAAAAPLEGYVRFDRGRPAAGVVVLARPVAGRALLIHRALTDEYGHYRFDYLPPGGSEIRLLRGDGRVQSLGTFDAGRSGVETRIDPGSVVSGQVLDGDANRRTGVPDFALRLARLPLATGEEELSGEVRTNEEGYFLLEDVSAGIYEVRASTPGWFFDPEAPRVDVPGNGLVKVHGFFAVTTRSVRGRVEGPDGKPAVGARVVLLPDPTRAEPPGGWPTVEAALTDADGVYVLRGLRGASGYRLAVSAKGLAGKVTEPFDVAGKTVVELAPILLARGWRLEIRARLPGGAPVVGLKVAAVPARYPVDADGGAGLALLREGRTDADGVAMLADLPAEDLRAFVVDTGRWVPARTLVAYPRSGDARTWSVTLFAAPALRGSVVIDGDVPPLGLLVRAVPRDGSPMREDVLDADGTFVLEGLPSAPVDVIVRPVAAVGADLTRVEGLVPGTGDHVEIVLPSLVGVRGRVLDLDPLGPPAKVRLEAPRLDLVDDVYRWRTVAFVSLEAGASRASYAFARLSPGTYAVRAVQGDNDSGATTVILVEGIEGGVDLVMPEPGRVAGTVLGERDLPLLGAEVRLVRLRGDGDAPGRSERGVASRATDARGAFVFESVAPGVWRLEALRSGTAPSVTTLRVGEGESVVVEDILLGSGGTLEGEVTDGEGRTLDGARLLLDALEDGVPERTVETGRDGLFRAEALRPGAWRLTLAAHAGPFTDLEAWVEVVEGETTRVELTAPGRGTICGRVVRSGQPVPDAVLHLLSFPIGEDEPPRRLFARSDGDGLFAWDGLPAGRYAIDLLDGGVRATRPIDLIDGDRVEVDIEAWGGRIPGEVLLASGTPVQGATVTVRRPGAVRDLLVGRVRTGPDGRFLVAGLPAGRTYDIDVDAPGLPPGHYEGADAEVLGSERFVTITVGRGGTLDLRVVDPVGRGVRGVSAWLETEGGRVLDARPYAVAPSGRLELDGVPEGSWRVGVHAPGFGRPNPPAIRVVEGEVSRLEVVLRPAASLRLEVTARQVDPVTRARITLLRLPERRLMEIGLKLDRVRLAPPAGFLLRAGAILIEDLAAGDYALVIDAGSAFEPVTAVVSVPEGEDLERRVELVRR